MRAETNDAVFLSLSTAIFFLSDRSIQATLSLCFDLSPDDALPPRIRILIHCLRHIDIGLQIVLPAAKKRRQHISVNIPPAHRHAHLEVPFNT